jgi:DNA-binding CsgD family transcriptional regulator
MNNHDLIYSLLSDLKELFSDYQNIETPELEEKKKKLAESLEILAPVERETKSLLELNKKQLYSHNSVYENYRGQTVDLFSWVERIHPDDVIFILRLFKATIILLGLLPKNRIKDFNLVYKHRLKNKKGGYDCYILSFKVVLCDAIGKPWVLLMKSVRCSVVPAENTNFYRIISMKPLDLFKKYKLLDKDEYCMLTNTEKNIACAVNSGKSCQKIPKCWNRSILTTYKHFNNINKKMGLSATRQSCAYASQMGLLQTLILFCSVWMDDIVTLI